MSDILIDEWKDDPDNCAMKYLLASFDSFSTDLSIDYFSIQCENRLGSLTGLLSVNSVMDNAYPEKSIDWEQVPNPYLCSLFLQKYSQIILPFSQEPMAIKVDNICSGKPIDEHYPMVNSDIGELFICTIKGKFQWISLSSKEIGAIADFHFGYSHISLSLLKSILPGDVLLIENISQCLIIGQKKWINFEWKGEGNVELNEFIEHDSEMDDTDKSESLVSDKIEGLHAIDAIPVTVSFVLASKMLLIEQITKLSPGQKIELPKNIYQKILLKVNGISIAQGELIKVGDKFAIEIQHSYSKKE